MHASLSPKRTCNPVQRPSVWGRATKGTQDDHHSKGPEGPSGKTEFNGNQARREDDEVLYLIHSQRACSPWLEVCLECAQSM
jgi:hypothetical protein